MPEEVRIDKKTRLALAIARGQSIDAWARKNDVPRRTAFRWASDPKVRREVEASRRQAIGRLSSVAMKAANGIVRLAKESESESIQLRAWRAILADQIAVSRFSDLEYRMTQTEEQLRERKGHTSGALKQSAPGDGPCPRAGAFRLIECPALHALSPRTLPLVRTCPV
jgi:hypothetical protein